MSGHIDPPGKPTGRLCSLYTRLTGSQVDRRPGRARKDAQGGAIEAEPEADEQADEEYEYGDADDGDEAYEETEYEEAGDGEYEEEEYEEEEYDEEED